MERPETTLFAIAKGTYTEIVSIAAPVSARAGDLVAVTVRVKNLWNTSIYISLAAKVNGVGISVTPGYANVGAGAIYSFTASFTMPDNGVRLTAQSYYYAATVWYEDDSFYTDIALEGAPPPPPPPPPAEPDFFGFGISEYSKV